MGKIQFLPENLWDSYRLAGPFEIQIGMVSAFYRNVIDFNLDFFEGAFFLDRPGSRFVKIWKKRHKL